MRRLPRAFITVLGLLSGAPLAQAERPVPLVNGNGAYAQAAALLSPASDARLVAVALDRLRDADLRTGRTVADRIAGTDVALARYPSGQFAAGACGQIATPGRGPQARDCAHCPEMVSIPAGSFTMGSPANEKDRDTDEEPQRPVTIGHAFSLGKSEVTRGEYAAFVKATNRGADESCLWHAPGFDQTDRDPVVCVDWNDARAYIAWLSQTTGKTYRLPTEAEWEYAARAGTTTARYWGERPEEACRYANIDEPSHHCDDGHARTAPAEKFQANAFGLHGVIGNVWEWTEDCWNGSYAGAPSDGSAWLGGDCSYRVVRGGSWRDNPRLARAAVRGRFPTSARNQALGFRVARTD